MLQPFHLRDLGALVSLFLKCVSTTLVPSSRQFLKSRSSCALIGSSAYLMDGHASDANTPPSSSKAASPLSSYNPNRGGMIPRAKSLIGWLLNFAMPKIWHVLILTIAWLATKTCQPFTCSLPNLCQLFLPSFDLSNL
jgi:hypothetical protein